MAARKLFPLLTVIVAAFLAFAWIAIGPPRSVADVIACLGMHVLLVACAVGALVARKAA